MKDYLLFLKRFLSNPSSIGALFPSSKQLGAGMAKKVTSSQPLRYLEIGGGSGALTKHIVKKIQPHDSLDIVEMDPHFCQALQRKYGHLPNVKIYEASILDFPQEAYDVVISSLPLNSFDSSLVDQILLKYTKLVKQGGYISFFEYIGLSRIKAFWLSGKTQLDFQTILCLKKSFVTHYCQEVEKIWLNFPPARIFHCQL